MGMAGFGLRLRWGIPVFEVGGQGDRVWASGVTFEERVSGPGSELGG